MLRRRKRGLPYHEKKLRQALQKWQGGPYLVLRVQLRREMEQLVEWGWEVIENSAGQLNGTTTSGYFTLRMSLKDHATYILEHGGPLALMKLRVEPQNPIQAFAEEDAAFIASDAATQEEYERGVNLNNTFGTRFQRPDAEVVGHVMRPHRLRSPRSNRIGG